jgi:hypothetical protein
MDVDSPLLDVQSTVTKLDIFKQPFPIFGDVLDVILPYDISIPGEDFIKGDDQVAFTEMRRKEIRQATREKKWRPQTISAIKKLV